MEPFPTLDEVYNLVLWEENQKSFLLQSSPLIESSVVAIATDNKMKGKPDVTCSHCGKKGHIKEKFFSLIGFPKDFKFTKDKDKGSFRK